MLRPRLAGTWQVNKQVGTADATCVGPCKCCRRRRASLGCDDDPDFKLSGLMPNGKTMTMGCSDWAHLSQFCDPSSAVLKHKKKGDEPLALVLRKACRKSCNTCGCHDNPGKHERHVC